MAQEIEFAEDGGTPQWRARHKAPSFTERLRAIPFWKRLLFILGWGFVGPMLVMLIGFAMILIFQPEDTPRNAWLLVGADVAFVGLMFLGAVQKKLGYGKWAAKR